MLPLPSLLRIANPSPNPFTSRFRKHVLGRGSTIQDADSSCRRVSAVDACVARLRDGFDFGSDGS